MDVIAEARRQGFVLEERVLGDAWVHGWSRDGDERQPCFLADREALISSDHLLRHHAVFEP